MGRNWHRRCLSVLVAAGLLGAGAQASGAATICVQDPSCPAGAETAATVQGALTTAADAAHPGRDRIQVGPGTFSEAGLADAAGNPVDLVGAGMGQTLLTRPAGDVVQTLSLEESASIVSDLTVSVADGSHNSGLLLGATATGVAVIAPETAVSAAGVAFAARDATFADGSISLPLDESTTGLLTAYGGGTVRDSTITATTGTSNVERVQRVRIVAVTGVSVGDSIGPLDTTVDDALVQLPPTGPGTALRVDASPGPRAIDSQLVARHVTAIGNGDPGSTGVSVNAQGDLGYGARATATVSDTILRGFGTDVSRTLTPNSAIPMASLAIDWSDYDPARRVDQGPETSAQYGALVEGAHNVNVDPGFRDPASGDYRLAADSPLIDRGDPAPLAPDESGTDFDGAPRVIDGNGDGSPISDIGAYEYQPALASPPVAPAVRPFLNHLSLTNRRFAVTPKRRARSTVRARRGVAHGTTVRFTLSRSATVRLTIQRVAPGRRRRVTTLGTIRRSGRHGRNRVVFGGRIGRRTLTPGSYRIVATALAGRLTSPARRAGFTIVAP